MGMGSAELRAQAAECDAEARASFERCDTDGFLSQWASGINGQLLRQQAELADAGGMAWFAKWELVNAAGEVMDARVCQTRYGAKWRIDSTDEWIKYGSAGAAKRKGYAIVDRIEQAAAFAVIAGEGTGMSGAASCYVAVMRKGARAAEGWRSVGVTAAELARYEAWVAESGVGM